MSGSGSPDLPAMLDLLALMVKLRDPVNGCPWDREQTFESIAPYTLEEAYEVVDAIESGEPSKLREELGDLLFQVVFYAQMAQERGWFDFDAIARAIHDKLVSRHPHVFGEQARQASGSVATPGEVLVVWEELKARERAAAAADKGSGPAGVLADVPRALPSLTRAQKLGKRAGRVGFDWTDMRDVRAKITEELAELDEAALELPATESPSAHLVEELGDLLFAIANWGRHVGADAESALRAANAKFERRFASMEALARQRALVLTDLTLDAWEDLWREAKRAERGLP